MQGTCGEVSFEIRAQRSTRSSRWCGHRASLNSLSVAWTHSVQCNTVVCYLYYRAWGQDCQGSIYTARRSFDAVLHDMFSRPAHFSLELTDVLT